MREYKDRYQLDPLIAEIIDQAAKLPLIELQFPAHMSKRVKSNIKEIFEKIRPDIEYALIQQGLL